MSERREAVDRVQRWAPWAALGLVLLAAAAVRFVELGRSAVRADEINYLEQAARGQPLGDLWANPPWLNQIPLADSIAIVWHWFRAGPPNERTVREPFAVLGTLTVVGTTLWLARRRGLAAGVLLGAWMGLVPFHVYQSREAYYYVVVMACAAGMTLTTVDLLARLRAGAAPSWRDYAVWTAWTLVTCLTHMSTWVVAAMCWLCLLVTGIRCVSASRRRMHLAAMIVSAVVIAGFMERWVWRALAELKRVSDGTGHIGGDFAWVAPQVIPFFTAGANVCGIVAMVAVLGAGVYAFALDRRKPGGQRDLLYESLTLIVGVGFITVYAYVGLVGGGVAKISYFSVLFPAFLVWAAYTLDVVATAVAASPVQALAFRVALPCLAVAVLAKPAWMITRLEGKPTPYKKLRDWLDANLDEGSVVLVDRWFEPWNEMARYAPEKVFVTFTVPDEPYETYRQLRWRDVTQRAIEDGKAQAFIRLTRNHEKRDGVWTWPETFFAHRARVVDDAGVWLRDRGYAPNESFYSEPNRLMPEIFYDLREDAVNRRRAAGADTAVFFDHTMRHVKSGPLAMLPVQTQQFMDWRLLEQAGTLRVSNLTDSRRSVTVRLRGVAPRGPKVVQGPNGQRHEFRAGQLEEWLVGPFDTEPGENAVALTDPRWTADKNPLLISEAEVVTDGAAAP